MRVSDIAERFGVSERAVYRRLGAALEPEAQHAVAVDLVRPSGVAAA